MTNNFIINIAIILGISKIETKYNPSKTATATKKGFIKLIYNCNRDNLNTFLNRTKKDIKKLKKLEISHDIAIAIIDLNTIEDTINPLMVINVFMNPTMNSCLVALQD